MFPSRIVVFSSIIIKLFDKIKYIRGNMDVSISCCADENYVHYNLTKLSCSDIMLNYLVVI